MGGAPLRCQAPRQARAELRRLSFVPLIIVDEVGYIPFDPEAANLMFSLVSARYERASMIVTSNKPFSAWGEIFGDDVVAAAMIDRLVHHAEILALKGDSHPSRQGTSGPPGSPSTERARSASPYGLSSAGAFSVARGVTSQPAQRVTFRVLLKERGRG
jgi:IstB-like ATP binding protein